MHIALAQSADEKLWNAFVRDHYPPVGGFMQTWEWGNFQIELGRHIERYLVTEGEEVVALFTLVRHHLPAKAFYLYAPRGPVIHKDRENGGRVEICKAIQSWARVAHPRALFLRLEPPCEQMTGEELGEGFSLPDYYIQPRYNHVVHLQKDAGVASGFHPSTRSNIHRAEKRGVRVEVRTTVTSADLDLFFRMAQDTIARNSGTNAYPARRYFDAFIKTIPMATNTPADALMLTMRMFIGYEGDDPAGMHFVLYFGNTATYMYGASLTAHLRTKVTTYLHWYAMQDARERGYTHYDIGGVDEVRWPKLTTFKRQFRGTEYAYMGNIDIPLRPMLYAVYNLVRRYKPHS